MNERTLAALEAENAKLLRQLESAQHDEREREAAMYQLLLSVQRLLNAEIEYRRKRQ